MAHPPPLTIRNLASTTITLKRLETFEDPHTKKSKAGTGLLSSGHGLKNTTDLAPTAPALSEHANSFNCKEVNIRLDPFESVTINLQTPPDVGTKHYLSTATLRITIQTLAGERYRIDTNPSYTQKSSSKFIPLTPNPSTSFTGLYHPSNPIAHLTIHANHLIDYKRWMKELPDMLPLSGISIPGTHNSHTHYRALPSVRCQVLNVQTQLENGIRFLDIRVQPSSATDIDKKDLYLVHGAFPISLTGTKYLSPILSTCYTFLTSYPSETILISLKREGVGNAADHHLAAILEKHYFTPNREKWYTGTKLPYLGAVRGKLVLVRRYEMDIPKPLTSSASPPSSSSSSTNTPSTAPPAPPRTSTGLDATAWPNNSPHALHGPFSIQDWCDVLHPSSIPTKLHHANAHLARSAATTALLPGVNTDKLYPVPPAPLHLNFLSGSNFWNVGTWPERISSVVNRGVEEWVCGRHYVEETACVGRGESWRMGAEEEEGGGRINAAVDGDGIVSTGSKGGERVGDSVGGEGAGVVRRKARIGDGGTGVVVMDHVGLDGDWDLVGLIVGLNVGVLLKVREAVAMAEAEGKGKVEGEGDVETGFSSNGLVR
ncbi:PLC-like phosphodiesterase [Byssothecium circinans]|uniref:PLC-like phosphodiesterase n=1 Tax=Byssothecium circinans TaxID=147558 RepID=A0A6A5TNU1_9PLEO|nr:PLC-like phosphodiesterase [Byssothecium circinans]